MSKTQKDKIKEELDFYIKNPTLAAVFEHTVIHKGKSNATSGAAVSHSSISPIQDLVLDGNNVTIVYDGQQDISKPKIFDRDGNIKASYEVKNIWFKNGMVSLRAEDEPSKRQIEFLLTMSVCYPGTFGKRSPIEHVKMEDTFTKAVDPMTGYEMAKLIELLGTTKSGKELLLKKAKNSGIYHNYENVDAMVERGGMALLIKELQNEALTKPLAFSKAFKGYEKHDSVIEKGIQNKIFAYNKKTKSFQYLDSRGDFEKDAIIFLIDEDNEIIRNLLLSDHLVEEIEKLNDLKFRIEDATANS